MRITKAFHRVWLLTWLGMTVLLFLIPHSIYFDDNESRFQELRLKNFDDCLEESVELQSIGFFEDEADVSKWHEDCQDREAYTEAMVNAGGVKFWVVGFALFSVFIPYVTVAIINTVDSFVSEPDDAEQKIEDILKDKANDT